MKQHTFTRGKLYFSDKSRSQRALALEYLYGELASAGIAGATITRTTGVWNGETEFGFELETLGHVGVGTETLQIQLEEIAESLRKEFNQTSVLVTVETVVGKLTFVEEL